MKIIKNSTFEFWEEIAKACDYATFFHTPTWARIIGKSYSSYRIATKGFILALTANTFMIIRIMEPFWFVAGIIMMIPRIIENEFNSTRAEDSNR